MKIFSFVKKVFALGLTVLSSSITSALNCISMNRLDVNSNNPIFYHFSVKKIGAVVIVMVLMILMQRCVFLIL